VETLYAPGFHPVQDTLALQAIRDLFTYLPAAQAEPEDVDVRLRGQLAAWMSYFAPAAIQLGLSHKLSKAFGTRFGVPHGITSCITLPPVMRYMAQTHAAALARMAHTLGVATPDTPAQEAAFAAAAAVADLVYRLGLPGRLRDADVPREAIPSIAADAVGGGPQQTDAIDILEAAW
jgi:alcohol dehydrogenase class IV